MLRTENVEQGEMEEMLDTVVNRIGGSQLARPYPFRTEVGVSEERKWLA
jgi:hypothetical protein